MKTGGAKKGGFFSAWQLPLLDDAGVERELLPMQAQPSGTARLDRVRDRAHLVYGELTDFGKMLIRMTVLILPMAVVLPVAMIWLQPQGVPRWVIGTVTIAVLMVCALIQTKWAFMKLSPRAPEIADAYLDEGICPCCAYNLAGSVAALDRESGDGGNPESLVRCAECGASWRRSRIHRIAPEETAGARETLNFQTLLRAQAMVYNSMAFTDDSGQNISLARYVDLKRLKRAATGAHRAKLEEATRKLRYRGLWLRLLFASIVLPIMVGIIVEFARMPVGGFGLMHGLKALGLVVWMVGIVAIVGSDIGRSGAWRADLLKTIGLCPACGSMLTKRAECDDVTCTECRAVWKWTAARTETGVASADSPRSEAR